MKSPKQRFLEIKQVADRHRDIVDSSQFTVAMDMALLEVLWNLPSTDDVAKAAANHWRLCGAVTYMIALEGLANVTTSKPVLPDDNLIPTR